MALVLGIGVERDDLSKENSGWLAAGVKMNGEGPGGCLIFFSGFNFTGIRSLGCDRMILWNVESTDDPRTEIYGKFLRVWLDWRRGLLSPRWNWLANMGEKLTTRRKVSWSSFAERCGFMTSWQDPNQRTIYHFKTQCPHLC